MSLPKTLVLQTMGMISSKFNRRKVLDARCAISLPDAFTETEFMLAPGEASTFFVPSRLLIAVTDSPRIQYVVKQDAYELTLDLTSLLVMGPSDGVFFINAVAEGDPARIRVICA